MLPRTGAPVVGQDYQASIRASAYPPRATAERDEVHGRPLGRSLSPGNRGPRGHRPPSAGTQPRTTLQRRPNHDH
jgi:hypothetical protein